MSETYLIRPAMPADADKLTELAFLSKAHWGYSKQWLESWRNDLTVTPDMLRDSIAFVAELDGEIIGFWYRSIPASDEPSPGMLFIHPTHMGKGLGKKLWEKIKEDVIRRGIKTFTIEADPNAVPFYLKLGAVQINEKESTVIPGRMIPILKFTFDNK